MGSNFAIDKFAVLSLVRPPVSSPLKNVKSMITNLSFSGDYSYRPESFC